MLQFSDFTHVLGQLYPREVKLNLLKKNSLYHMTLKSCEVSGWLKKITRYFFF